MSYITQVVEWIRPSLPAMDDDVRASVTRTLADTAIRLNLVVAALAPPTAVSWVLLLWVHADQPRLLVWLAAVTTTSTMMLVVVTRYRAGRRVAEETASDLSFVLLAAGCAWGALGTIVMPEAEAWQAVIGMMLLSTMAVNAIFAASVSRMFWAFQLPVALIGSVTFFNHGTGVGRAIGFVLIYALPFSAVLALINRGANERGAYFAAVSNKNTEELQRLNTRLAHEAAHDPLTGIPNRQSFNRRLEAAVAEHPGRVAVMFMDLDRFKNINDQYGHATGDDVLDLSAQRILSRLRPHDVLARLGGDEFTAIVAGVTSIADVERIAGRILEGFEEPFHSGGRAHQLGVSIGIALPPDPASAAELLHMADAALYDAKRAGRGRFAIYGAGS